MSTQDWYAPCEHIWTEMVERKEDNPKFGSNPYANLYVMVKIEACHRCGNLRVTCDGEVVRGEK